MTNNLIKALEKRKGEAQTVLERHKAEFPEADHFFAKGVIAGLQEAVSISANYNAQPDRVKIAAGIVSGMAASDYWGDRITRNNPDMEFLVKTGIELADALIAELNKRE